MKLNSPQRFRAAMDAQHYSCAQLAETVGCSKQMIGHLRTGRVKGCTKRLALSLEFVLEVPRGELFTPTESESAA